MRAESEDGGTMATKHEPQGRREGRAAQSDASATRTTGAVAAGIMLRDKGDILDMAAAAGGPPRQGMRGFDPDYVDIVDYIVRITHRIWEEKAVGLIYDTYGHNLTLWTNSGLVKGREAIVADTLRTLSAYPNVKIYVDEVVWTGNDADGYHTSMLATSVRYNTGYSIYGPPTGRVAVRRGIANCFVKGNRIYEEWLVHDELAVVRQLGFDPYEAAARMARAEAERGVRPVFAGEDERVVGQYVPTPYPAKTTEGFDIEDFIRRGTHEIWNRRMLNAVNDYYAPTVRCHTSSAKELYGTGDLKVHILGLLGAFPDAWINVEHLYWNELADGSYRTAMRWTLLGTHTGPGLYGAPTGKQIRLMGITQHRVENGKIVEEWSVYDEFALLKQLAPID
jgi:predicted ester cyclase